MKKTGMIALLLVLGMTLFAKANFTVIYLSRTETNMEATSYIKKQIKKQKAPLKVSFAMGFSKAGNSSDPVVILNTGSANSLDAKIEEFLSSQSDTSRFILVNLYKMGNKSFYSTTPAGDSSVGVDEVSASSYYDDPRTDSMHEKWVAEMIRLIEERI